MRKGYGLLLLVLIAILSAGGCRLVIGFEDAVLEDAGAGGRGGSGSTGSTGGATASCSDGVKNGSETGKDCGGSCSPCPDGSGCQVGPDCENKVCSGGSCTPPACDDKVKNGAETDMDCGGVASTCPACANGKACNVGSDCASVVCDAGVCLSNYVWAKDLGGTGATTTISGVALDAQGNATVVGALNGTTDFGGGKLTSVSGGNAFVARYDSLGHTLSAALSGGGGTQVATSVAVDVNGNSVVVGNFEGNFDLGCSSVAGAGSDDVFVAKLNPSGVCLWNASFGDALDQDANAVSTDAMGNIVVLGNFDGSLAFGGGGTKLTSLGDDVFLTKLSPSGAHIWSKRFGDADLQRASGLALDGAGNIVIVGKFFGSIAFEPTPLVDAGVSSAADLFLAKFDPSGNCLWSKSFVVEGGFAAINSIVADTVGNIFAAVELGGSVDLGGGTIMGGAQNKMFLAKFDKSGKLVWNKQFGAGQDTLSASVALDSVSDLVVEGTFTGTVDFGGGPVSSVGMNEGIVVKFDTAGNYLWSKAFGSNVGSSHFSGVYDLSSVLLVGTFGSSPLDFGGGTLTSVGLEDTFLARLRTP